MKIDRSRLRKGTSEIPLECQALIERLRQCSRLELLEELSKINTWTFGKCELYHWIGVLDIFDAILEEATQTPGDNKWILSCDTFNAVDKKLLLWTLHFTTLLIEHSFSRHLYNSMEHLLTLMSSSDMNVVLAVLNLLYMFSKRSNFITRLVSEKRQALLSRLHYLAESWGGKENGFGLADCCVKAKDIPHSATTLHFEFNKDYSNEKDKDTKETKGKQNSAYIHVENVDKLSKLPAEIMEGLTTIYYVPKDKEMWLFTHVRLANHFADYSTRLLCVQARLQALSVLVYSNALQDSVHTLLYNGLLEELVELVELDDSKMVEIRSAALRTLTSIIHLDRNPHFPKKPGSRLHNIIDVTGANQYHGFLPTLVRNCISLLTRQTNKASTGTISKRQSRSSKATMANIPLPNSDFGSKFPLPLATALFSFLYHLASYEAGGESLVSCGMMESLLQVINWHGVELEHITFVTRAVRVIDLITNIDMQAFHSYGGLQSFINRLDVEVNLCVKEQSYEFKSVGDQTGLDIDEDSVSNFECVYNAANAGKTCLPQRAALLKSMLNFLKKALQDTMFAENVRHVMEGILPVSLKHIIANAEYYGPSLFLLATDLVTVYVFQEPTLLSTLQDNGLTDVILHALLTKDVPATREVLGSLPNVFSALCLNARGLQSFVKRKPFERLLKVLISPQYLSAMRRRRSSDPLGDTASNLGNAMDELMRHQPSLKSDATAAIIKLLNDLCQKGSDPKYICWRPHSKSETSPINVVRSSSNTEGSSDEEEDDEEEASTSSHNAQNDSQETTSSETSEKTPIALVDYILNIMKFIDAILSNNSTDDHCREFVTQGGLEPLLKILGLPNLPVDCPVTVSAQAVASVCKSILNLAHEPEVLKQGLLQLNDVLQTLKPLYSKLDSSNGSKLLHELATAPHLESAFNNPNATPLLHAMAAAHGYVMMFVHVCRTGQSDIRALSLQHWGSGEGLTVLRGLAELYTSLVWESTLLLALCSDDAIPVDCDFGREDMEKLNVPIFDKTETSSDTTAANVASALESLSTNPTQSMDIDGETTSSKPSTQQLKYIKPLLGASSRLGRALAELFGLLVKLCVGTPVRQRRGQNIVSTPVYASPYARSVATTLNFLLAHGLNYERLPASPIPKFKLTFLICSVGFTSPMLFDEKRYPYHLMLHTFSTLGGQSIFFNTFKWALSAAQTIELDQGLEHPELPEGTGEFLDAWLMLLEKMVNPKAILDSPHAMTNKSSSGVVIRRTSVFNPLRYLIQIHKLAFEAVMLMWGKKPLPSYGIRMTESILSILRNILRGEKIIKERLSKGEDKANAASTANRTETEVNQENLRQLMDMGFSREHAMEALTHCVNVELATDYLLSNPPHFVRPGTSGMDVDEDDQVIQAIALSLGETVPPAVEKRKEDSDEDKVPLAEDLIDNFTFGALPVCLDLIEMIPETVYKVCELLGTIMKRNGTEFRDELLDKLLGEIKENCELIFAQFCKSPSSPELLQELCDSKISLRLGCYIHLYTLFFEVPSYFDMRVPCGLAVYRAELVQHFIELISLAEGVMTATKKTTEPKWLTPILLLLDSLGKVSICTQRKRNMHVVTNRVWKWYDLVTGKWTPYSATNNKLINDSYWNGDQNIRVTCGRRRYTITFANMLQCNDETGNNRPISMTPINLANDTKYDPKNTEVPNEPMEVDEVILTDKEDQRCVPAPSLTKEDTTKIVRSCVRLMHLQIDKDLLHALMRICLRLTRDFDNAKVFVKEGGVKCLLRIRQTSAFSGYGPLATVLIRHTLEEPEALAHSIEKVIRGRTFPSIPPPYKELMYLVRQIGGAVARSPETFFEVAKSILRVDCTIFRRPEDLDCRMPIRAEPITRQHFHQMEEEVSIQVIVDLLNALLQPLEFSAPETNEVRVSKPSTSTASVIRDTMYQRASNLLSNNSASHEILPDIQDIDSPVIPITRVKITRTPSETALDNRLEQELVKRPMLAKHCILKILADAVVSYGAIARIITDFVFKAGCCDVVTEDCTALAFMFDKLLPITDNVSDRDCSMMCRVLIAAISSCNHCPDAQSILVNEVKAALGRALLMAESFEKHNQIQLITGIITTMIENCPPSNQLRVFKNQSFNGQINNIVKLMLRKGIFNDLARISHFLDLSSPNFPMTVNSSLKPMESLSRIVNQPVSGNAANRMNKKSHPGNLDDSGVTQSGATSTEATNAQGEEAIEDAENTEHDISAVASSLEANPDVAAVHEESDNVLDHIMEQLLEHGNNETNRSYSEVASGRNHHTMDIDDDALTGYEHEPDATEELMSTDSGDSDSNASDQEVEDEDNDDNEVDDDDIDEGEDNDDNNYENDVNNDTFEVSSPINRDEDILMIQYADHDGDDGLPMVRWNENGFTMPLFDGLTTVIDQPAPASHPLLVARHSSENGTSTANRSQRTTRTRRYQYLQLNSRSSNPPVILQRLLGPVAQNLSLSTNEIMNSPIGRDTARVVVMDNFSLIPTNEEQIDFVDQSGYLFGPSLAATLNHVPSVLHWWNEESKLLDIESTYDITISICNKLIPNLMKYRNIELAERKQKKSEEEKAKPKPKAPETAKNSYGFLGNSTYSESTVDNQNLPPLPPLAPLTPLMDLSLPDHNPGGLLLASGNDSTSGNDSDSSDCVIVPSTNRSETSEHDQLTNLSDETIADNIELRTHTRRVVLNPEFQDIVENLSEYEQVFTEANPSEVGSTEQNRLSEDEVYEQEAARFASASPQYFGDRPEPEIPNTGDRFEEDSSSSSSSSQQERPVAVVVPRSFQEGHYIFGRGEDETVQQERPFMPEMPRGFHDGHYIFGSYSSELEHIHTGGRPRTFQEAQYAFGNRSEDDSSDQDNPVNLPRSFQEGQYVFRNRPDEVPLEHERPGIAPLPPRGFQEGGQYAFGDNRPYNSTIYTPPPPPPPHPYHELNPYDMVEQNLRISIAEVVNSDSNTDHVRHQNQEFDNFSNTPEQFDDPSDEQSSLDNLSEVERVASEGISGRGLQNATYSYTLEPFEEPSDTPPAFPLFPPAINPNSRYIPPATLTAVLSSGGERLAIGPDDPMYDYLAMRTLNIPHAHQNMPNVMQPHPLCMHEMQHGVPNAPLPHPSGLHSCSLVASHPCMGHGPVPRAPIPHAPIPHAPMSHGPMPHAPMPHAPMPHAPMPHVPLPHSPMAHGPMPHAPMSHAPMPHAPMPHAPMPHAPMPHASMPHAPMPHAPMPHAPMPHAPIPQMSMPHSQMPHSPMPHAPIPQIPLASHSRCPLHHLHQQPRRRVPRPLNEIPPLAPLYPHTRLNLPLPQYYRATSSNIFSPPPPIQQNVPQNLTQSTTASSPNEPIVIQDSNSDTDSQNALPTAPPPPATPPVQEQTEPESETPRASSVDVVMQDSSTTNTEPTEEIPEGVDPSFLEALPPEMRREVLEQYRILYSGPSGSGNGEASVAIPSEVNPEFLAALPPAIQEEVLTQQRLEQQRQAAAHANPDEPVDAGAFFETLQPSLRTMILSDMEDSQMSVLPPDLAAEAQTLRRDWEARNRQMVQERFFQSSLPTIIRHSARGRLSSRLNTHLLPQRAQWSTWGRAEVIPISPVINSGARVRGRQLLDHESLSCLLVLLFADDPKLNNLRLHRVIRNLCYHGPTREWIIKALLSIIDKSVHSRVEESVGRTTRQRPKPGPLTSKLLTDSKNVGNGANWLNIRMEAALGCHANVFVINRNWGKRSDRSNLANIVIHPQAAPAVCKNALDLFITLSKNFPTCFLPLKLKEDKEEKNKTILSPSKSKTESTDFWEMLLKLDSASSKKGKSLAKTHSNLSLCSETDNTCTSFEQSAFGQLLCMLSSPIIYRSSQLTDRLLRLLSVITTGMPELSKNVTTSKSLKSKLPQYESVSAPKSALNLAINVLTYKSCSEEGLEDATNLLLNLSNCSIGMSHMILGLLLNGAKSIGDIVREQIQNMLCELQKLNKVQKPKVQDEATPSSSKGTIANRFTKETVIITASSKIKASYDLQLPCMAPLTSKTSSQLFFLRVLRVIVQIREAIHKAIKKDEDAKEKAEEAEKAAEAGAAEAGAAEAGAAEAGDAEASAAEASAAGPVPAEQPGPKPLHLLVLSDQLYELENLWETLSLCLLELEHTPDDHAVLVLQPAVEAFFLVHSLPQTDTDFEIPIAKPAASTSIPPTTSTLEVDLNASTSSSSASQASVESDQSICESSSKLKFLNFAEKHRTVLNQILRQSTAHLSDGPFSVLVDHTKVLDFDVKRKYFRTELERLDQGLRREETAVHVRRSHVFEDSFRELYRRTPEEWKNRFYIVFEEEEGQDAGGLLREWYMIISRDIFNPMYALFTISPGDRVTYMINPASHYNPNHLCYYKFVGRVIAKAIYDNKLLECYFTRSFYKHILGISVKYTDMESEDYTFYRGLVYLLENNINDLGYDLTFSTEVNEFGVTETRDLITNGQNVAVTEENKLEYIRLSCQMKMTGAIRQQLNAFLEGFYDIIPKRLISIFNEQELELLISGLPNVDIDDLKTNTEYHKYQNNSLQIQWFWRALRSFDQADRAKFLQFVTGTSKVPLQGFANLEGMNGVQKFQIHRDDRSTDRLPSAHTCFNQLDLPVYETSEKLHTYLLKAIHECSEGFGFA